MAVTATKLQPVPLASLSVKEDDMTPGAAPVPEEIVIAGGGLAGCLTALMLSRQLDEKGGPKYRIKIIEKNDTLLDGASLIASRLHLGGEYPLDKETGIDCLIGALFWKLVTTDNIYTSVPYMNFLISKMTEAEGLKKQQQIEQKKEQEALKGKKSKAAKNKKEEKFLTLQRFKDYYEGIQNEYGKIFKDVQLALGWSEDEAAEKLFGKPEEFYRTLTPDEYGVYGEDVAGGFQTRERGFNVPLSLAMIQTAIESQPNIEVVYRHEVKAIRGEKGRFTVQCDDLRECFDGEGGYDPERRKPASFSAGQVVQAAWQGSPEITDASGGDVKPVNVYRRAMLFVDLPEGWNTGPAFKMLGGWGGMLAPYNDKVAVCYLPGPETAYIKEMLLHSGDAALPKNWQALPVKLTEEQKMNALRAAAEKQESASTYDQMALRRENLWPFLAEALKAHGVTLEVDGEERFGQLIKSKFLQSDIIAAVYRFLEEAASDWPQTSREMLFAEAFSSSRQSVLSEYVAHLSQDKEKVKDILDNAAKEEAARIPEDTKTIALTEKYFESLKKRFPLLKELGATNPRLVIRDTLNFQQELHQRHHEIPTEAAQGGSGMGMSMQMAIQSKIEQRLSTRTRRIWDMDGGKSPPPEESKDQRGLFYVSSTKASLGMRTAWQVTKMLDQRHRDPEAEEPIPPPVDPFDALLNNKAPEASITDIMSHYSLVDMMKPIRQFFETGEGPVTEHFRQQPREHQRGDYSSREKYWESFFQQHRDLPPKMLVHSWPGLLKEKALDYGLPAHFLQENLPSVAPEVETPNAKPLPSSRPSIDSLKKDLGQRGSGRGQGGGGRMA